MEGFIIEVKINKEIQRYQESILFGLSLRPMVFALLAIGMPPSWALALVLAGPAASVLGYWIGSGDWIVVAHRLRRGGPGN